MEKTIFRKRFNVFNVSADENLDLVHNSCIISLICKYIFVLQRLTVMFGAHENSMAGRVSIGPKPAE